ncbi:MAG: alpha/beta fold hydrolase [Chloroflexota bacterium]|nr:alpha/beta fold hydrolase [Dehalococcoidia bacterium]MDW8253384.1 alpha/beta fold hydrolase [Chloroflexota bacterium]
MTTHLFYAGPDHGPFVIGDGTDSILLVHGFPGTPRELRPLATRLAAVGWRARGILLPGFGEQIAALSRHTGRDWVRAAATEWRQLRQRARRTAILGYSFGATIAAALAASAPPDRLILVAPWWRLGVVGEFLLPVLKRIIPTVAPFRHANFDDPRLRAFFRDVAPDLNLDDPAVQEQLRRQLTIPTPTIDEIRRLGRQSLQALRRVRAPTLVLQGRHDQTVPVAATRQLLRSLGGPVHYIELEGGHDLIRLEAPESEQLAAAIVRFLQEEPPIIPP